MQQRLQNSIVYPVLRKPVPSILRRSRPEEAGSLADWWWSLADRCCSRWWSLADGWPIGMSEELPEQLPLRLHDVVAHYLLPTRLPTVLRSVMPKPPAHRPLLDVPAPAVFHRAEEFAAVYDPSTTFVPLPAMY
ncbi:hypothetical protein OESDEN_05624 [Oesophagostomum dentatum]|uniref:Uncharacterized protein n=1 Tax=Oesophagostomum dentatum TaxID=61180 RepID=A0A0B1TA38_OESDE|nr:hypothetical protein OESDEN_05624 [Oesophagostomum dentatum]